MLKPWRSIWGFSTLKILATVKLGELTSKELFSFSTLKILATVKQGSTWRGRDFGFSTLKILATVKLLLDEGFGSVVLVPLRF